MSKFADVPEDLSVPPFDMEDLMGNDDVWTEEEKIKEGVYEQDVQGDAEEELPPSETESEPIVDPKSVLSESATPFKSKDDTSGTVTRKTSPRGVGKGKLTRKPIVFKSTQAIKKQEVKPFKEKTKEWVKVTKDAKSETSTDGDTSEGRETKTLSYESLKKILVNQFKEEGIIPHSEYVDILYREMMASKRIPTGGEIKAFVLGIRAEKVCSNQNLLAQAIDKITQETAKLSMVQKNLEETRLKYESKLETVTLTLSDRIIGDLDEWMQSQEMPPLEDIPTDQPQEQASERGSRPDIPLLLESDILITPDMIEDLDLDQFDQPETIDDFLSIAIAEMGYSSRMMKHKDQCDALRLGPSKAECIVLYNGRASKELKVQMEKKMQQYYDSH